MSKLNRGSGYTPGPDVDREMSIAPIDRQALEAVVAPFGENRTLPADGYVARDVFDWEMDNIFRATWVCVGRSSELVGPGQIRAVDVAGESVLLARDSEGALTAFSNVCRHRGHELAPEGDAIDARLIRCPYHSWSYRFNGELRAAPTFTQTPGFEMSDYPLIPVRVAEYLGWAWVDLSNGAPPIAEHFGNLAELADPYETDRLTTAAVHSYEVDANWKVIVENYNECYHCSSIHPELCEVTPPDSGFDHQPTGVWCGGTMVLKDHAVTMSLDGSSKGVNFRRIAGEAARHVWYLTVVPNLLLSMHPDYVMTHRVTPISPGRTHVECAWLFAPEAYEVEGFDPSYAVDFWDITNREDWAACESVMKGVRRLGYRPGPLSSWEGTVYQFLAMVGHLYLGHGFMVPEVPVRELR
jgi:phenylpropionate dioxygenase-like ring-hydroxylating dioxygenase large terminal subunit